MINGLEGISEVRSGGFDSNGRRGVKLGLAGMHQHQSNGGVSKDVIEPLTIKETRPLVRSAGLLKRGDEWTLSRCCSRHTLLKLVRSADFAFLRNQFEVYKSLSGRDYHMRTITHQTRPIESLHHEETDFVLQVTTPLEKMSWGTVAAASRR